MRSPFHPGELADLTDWRSSPARDAVVRLVSRLAVRDLGEGVGDPFGLRQCLTLGVYSTVALDRRLSRSAIDVEGERSLVIRSSSACSSAIVSGLSVVIPRSIAAKMRIKSRNSASSRGRLEKRAFS